MSYRHTPAEAVTSAGMDTNRFAVAGEILDIKQGQLKNWHLNHRADLPPLPLSCYWEGTNLQGVCAQVKQFCIRNGTGI